MYTKVYNLEKYGFSMNWFMSWDMYTCAANHLKFKMYDESCEDFPYVDASHESGDPQLTGAASGSGFIKGKGLKLEISSETDVKFVALHHPIGGSPRKGACFTLCGEDSDDNDYNDVMICIWCFGSDD